MLFITHKSTKCRKAIYGFSIIKCCSGTHVSSLPKRCEEQVAVLLHLSPVSQSSLCYVQNVHKSHVIMLRKLEGERERVTVCWKSFSEL